MRALRGTFYLETSVFSRSSRVNSFLVFHHVCVDHFAYFLQFWTRRLEARNLLWFDSSIDPSSLLPIWTRTASLCWCCLLIPSFVCSTKTIWLTKNYPKVSSISFLNPVLMSDWCLRSLKGRHVHSHSWDVWRRSCYCRRWTLEVASTSAECRVCLLFFFFFVVCCFDDVNHSLRLRSVYFVLLSSLVVRHCI